MPVNNRWPSSNPDQTDPMRANFVSPSGAKRERLGTSREAASAPCQSSLRVNFLILPSSFLLFLRPAKFKNIFCQSTPCDRSAVSPFSAHRGLSPIADPVCSQAMHRDHHNWYSHRLSRDMGVNVYGHYGMPILAFPTSCGDEHEQEGQGMIRTLGPYLDAGRIRIFCINGVQSDSFSNKGAHPFHRSWLQAQYDDYVASEVFPFIDSQCQTPGIPITTYGASLGAYHAANTLFKHPDRVKSCYALSGVYDMRDSMDGMYDDNFYFNNPVDYMANQSDPCFLHQYE